MLRHRSIGFDVLISKLALCLLHEAENDSNAQCHGSRSALIIVHFVWGRFRLLPRARNLFLQRVPTRSLSSLVG